MFYVVIGFSTVHDARREAAQIGLVEARAHMRAMGSTLLLAAGSGLDAWKRRGDLRGALRAGDE